MGAPTTDGTTDPRAARRSAMRRATLHLVLGVALLDTIAMGGYYLVIAHAPDRTKLIFTGVWTVATALVVAFLLRRVRRVRSGRPPAR
ncbi:MAG: hypothetical protein ABJA80_15080 [bacterium]